MFLKECGEAFYDPRVQFSFLVEVFVYPGVFLLYLSFTGFSNNANLKIAQARILMTGKVFKFVETFFRLLISKQRTHCK